MKIKLSYIKDFINKFFDDGVPGIAAQTTFYFITAMFPLAIFIFSILSFIKIPPEQTMFFLLNALSPDVATIISDLISSVPESITITITSGYLSLWSISGAITTISRALNRFYGVEEDRHFLIVRLYGVVFTLLLIVSLVITFGLLIFGTIAWDLISKYLLYSDLIWNITRFSVIIILVSSVFGALYTIMPNKKIRFNKVLPGAVFTSMLWTISSFVFSFYVNNFSKFHVIYGGLTGIIILIMWLYMTSYIILIGGEFNSFKNKIAKK